MSNSSSNSIDSKKLPSWVTLGMLKRAFIVVFFAGASVTSYKAFEGSQTSLAEVKIQLSNIQQKLDEINKVDESQDKKITDLTKQREDTNSQIVALRLEMTQKLGAMQNDITMIRVLLEERTTRKASTN